MSKKLLDAYTNLVCNPTDLTTGNWKPPTSSEFVDVGESLTIGHDDTVDHSNFNYMAHYDTPLPDHIKTEKEIKAWLRTQEPAWERKKNQQGIIFTKYRIERYAKNSRMYKGVKND